MFNSVYSNFLLRISNNMCSMNTIHIYIFIYIYIYIYIYTYMIYTSFTPILFVFHKLFKPIIKTIRNTIVQPGYYIKNYLHTLLI